MNKENVSWSKISRIVHPNTELNHIIVNNVVDLHYTHGLDRTFRCQIFASLFLSVIPCLMIMCSVLKSGQPKYTYLIVLKFSRK